MRRKTNLKTTNKRDINNKEIFVGDILEFQVGGFNGRDVVVYKHDEFRFASKYNKNIPISKGKIVDNI